MARSVRPSGSEHERQAEERCGREGCEARLELLKVNMARYVNMARSVRTHESEHERQAEEGREREGCEPRLELGGCRSRAWLGG